MIEYTSEKLAKTDLPDNGIFVFGSNEGGYHGGGAALVAQKDFGAEMGVGRGLTGSSYALPTKDANLHTLPLNVIDDNVQELHNTVNGNKDLKFYITKVGCGLAGLTVRQIAPMFLKRRWPSNAVLPIEFSSKDNRAHNA